MHSHSSGQAHLSSYAMFGHKKERTRACINVSVRGWKCGGHANVCAVVVVDVGNTQALNGSMTQQSLSLSLSLSLDSMHFTLMHCSSELTGVAKERTATGVAGSHRVKDAWKLEGQQLAHQQREGDCREEQSVCGVCVCVCVCVTDTSLAHVTSARRS